MVAMTPQQKEVTERGGIRLLKKWSVGEGSWLVFLYFELTQLLFSNLAGGIGYILRNIFYRPLFKKHGRLAILGRGVVLRNPGAVALGNKTLIDDYCTLDARGDSQIVVGDNVTIGRFTSIVAKSASLEIAAGANIGSYCRVATQSKIVIGESTLIAAFCYIGPGNHSKTDSNQPLISQPMEIKGGVKIGAHVWIGAHVTILDGVEIGDGAVIGAHSLVMHDVPAGAKVAGVPAKIMQ